MNFPAEWKTRHGQQSSKRQKTSRRSRDNDRANAENEELENTESLLTQIQNKINSKQYTLQPESVRIDNVINTIPYKDIIGNVFENREKTDIHIPVITKAYEEAFMRECENAGERQCVNGQMCECMFIDSSNQFVGVEFLLPHEEVDETPAPCVLCQRQMVQKLFFDIMYDGKNFKLPIQKYGNIFGQPGEYAREVMLSCPATGPLHCMPYPFMSHQRNRYTVLMRQGTRWLQQRNVAYEDYKQVPTH